MAGPIEPAAVRISTSAMKRILKYEPRDLTISVEAGIPFAELNRELARNGQMIPVAGPYSDHATIGGVIAANVSESRRRGYGTARDLVIGMEFATLEGKLVRSGGMVVKNVAGLDMGKLMIGSFGTLAAIATLNFKLLPIPTVSRSLLIRFEDLKSALTVLAGLMKAGLNPIAADLLNPSLASRFGVEGFALALQFGGNNAVIERSTRESAALCHNQSSVRMLAQGDEFSFWSRLGALTPQHLEASKQGAIVRISAPLTECGAALETIPGVGHAMIASGIVRGYFDNTDAATAWLNASIKRGWRGVIEYCGAGVDRRSLTLWPSPGGDFEIMKGIKKMFDPLGALNRGRLYGLL